MKNFGFPLGIKLNLILKLQIFTLRLMANHAGELVVVNVVKALWKEFQERNWKEFEEYEVYKRHHFRETQIHNRFKSRKSLIDFLPDSK